MPSPADSAIEPSSTMIAAAADSPNVALIHELFAS
jgi:hypothetical protein